MNYAGLSSHEGFLPSFPAAFLCFPFHILTLLSIPLFLNPSQTSLSLQDHVSLPKRKKSSPNCVPLPSYIPAFGALTNSS